MSLFSRLRGLLRIEKLERDLDEELRSVTVLKSGFLCCDDDLLASSRQFGALVADGDLRELVEVFVGGLRVAGGFGGVGRTVECVETVGRDFQHGFVFR